MKHLTYSILLIFSILNTACSSEYQQRIGSDIQLDTLIREFNQKHPSITPLTKEELKAVIGSMRHRRQDSLEQIYPYFERMIEDDIAPDGIYLSYKNQWYMEGIRYEMELISICYESSKKERKSGMAGAYSYWIRQQFKNSREMTDIEKRDFPHSTFIVANPE